jgi:Mitochondrial carrier protein
MVSKVFEHPFDLTKVRLQSQVLDINSRFDGPIDCLTKTWRREGISGLYRVRLVNLVNILTVLYCTNTVYINL